MIVYIGGFIHNIKFVVIFREIKLKSIHYQKNDT